MKWDELLCKDRLSGDKFGENEELSMNPFERDYYTIVTSSYFRRLQKKTQVYVLDSNDFSRTRLTHSLEVSAIAEMLGKRIGEKIKEIQSGKLSDDFVNDLSIVLRCAGLLHDLGNPPFGHSGEEYIRDYFKNNEKKLKKILTEQMWLDFLNFEGNANNIRIVTKLGQSSNPDDNNYGMDLTCAVINSLIKYPYNSLVRKEESAVSSDKIKRGKIGYYHAEDWIVEGMLSKKTGTTNEKGLLKDPIMLIMEAADDIAYATADVEDAVKKKLLNINDVIEVLNGSVPDEIIDKELYVILKYVREQSIIDVVNQFIDNYEDIMGGKFSDELIDGVKCNLKELKKLLLDIFRERDKETEITYNSKKKIHDILDYLINAVLKENNSFSERLILKELEQYLEKGRREAKFITKNNKDFYKREKLYHQYMAVVDFVSGMTDSYVTIFWNKIFMNVYLKEKKQEYKNNCLKNIMSVPQYNGFKLAKATLCDIEYVDCWEDYEVAMILRCYINNSQVKGADNSRRVIGDLYKNWISEVEKYLTTDERKSLESIIEES